jgi:hypothetical protein
VPFLANEPIYELFISVRPDGTTLREIMTLLEQRLIRPIVARVFTTKDIKEAAKYVKNGRGRRRGEVVVMGIQSSYKRKCCVYSDLERDEDLASLDICSTQQYRSEVAVGE